MCFFYCWYTFLLWTYLNFRPPFWRRVYWISRRSLQCHIKWLKTFLFYYFLFPEITSEPVVDCMERFTTSSNARLSNLAKVFLQVKDSLYSIDLSEVKPPNLATNAWIKSDHVDWAALFNQLKSQSWLRVVQEGGPLAWFTNGKNRGSHIMDMKISFSRITKISK